MNYYEELGLCGNASVDEIRQAYKSLARVLHPDHQSEAHLRRMAELQMTRLNEILVILCDPALRARYDATLRARTAAPAPGIESSPQPRVYVTMHPMRPRKFRPSAGAIVWSVILMAAASIFALMLLYFEHDSGMVVYRATEETHRQTPASGKDPVQTTPPQPTQTSRALPELNRPVRHTEEPAPSPPAPTLQAREPTQPEQALASNPPQDPGTVPSRSVAEVTQPAAPSPSTVAAAAKTVARNPLIGTWLYVKPNTEEGGSKDFSYRPEYIEMVIKPGQEGKVLGRYKGQFHVSDRPISSEVAFRFEGTAGEGTNVFAWRGEDGASGQIRMRMVSDGVMEVNWYTTQFGSARKLASGTAVLYRD